MTMADTIAVMNAGQIEQMGSPAELYEAPDTTFVANFLGQSNLLEATRQGTSGGDVLLDVHGQRVVVPADRDRAGSQTTLAGVRPEKIRLQTGPEHRQDGANRLEGGVVVDASFSGVSTQYLVRMPWGQQLTVFTQNLAVGGVLAVGTPVSLAWDPAHTFALAGDASAGASVEDALVGAG